MNVMRTEFPVKKKMWFQGEISKFDFFTRDLQETSFLTAGESSSASRLNQTNFLASFKGFEESHVTSFDTHPNGSGAKEEDTSGGDPPNELFESESRKITDRSYSNGTAKRISEASISRSAIAATPPHAPRFIRHGSRTSSRTTKTPTSKNGGKSSKRSSYVLAVTEGRGQARCEVGIAAMDPKRPLLVLSQISDGQRYDDSLAKMNAFDFSEVIVPNTFVECEPPNKLYRDMRSRFPNVILTNVRRRHFGEAAGIDLVTRYCSKESNSVMVLLRDKFYALSAAAALIRYLEYTQNLHLLPHSLKIEYQGTEDTMLIDLDTANRLELIACMNHPEVNVGASLFAVVNRCRTKGGIRLLRANILQPTCSLGKIRRRLDCVAELVDDRILLHGLEAAVASFADVENLLHLCTHVPQQEGLRAAEHQLKYALLLKTTLELLPGLIASAENTKSDYFRDVVESLRDPRFGIMLDRILETVCENAKFVRGSVAAHLHACFAIKSGVNGLLDVAKKTYCEIIQEMTDHVNKLRESHDLPLRISFSAGKGFHIRCKLPPGRRKDLPREFVLVKKSKKTLTFYTADLVALDRRSQHVLDEIKLMTNAILFELLTDIRRDVGCLLNLCEIVAELDVIVSFAHVGSGKNYVKPIFGDELNLEESRHPILEATRADEVVPNDVTADSEKNFTILTGPNQSGKSIYIRQIALLQIMAQIGCFVPAKKATFKPTNRIFSRIGFDDSIESNASSLVVEMMDIQYMKQNMRADSIVIIDELCRGASVEEGANLALAVCEELLDSSSFVFFTTHYMLLTKLQEMYSNVVNRHFEMKLESSGGEKPSTRFTHVLKPGSAIQESYGLKVAAMTSFPSRVLSRAQEISTELSKTRKPDLKVCGLLADYEFSLRFKRKLGEIDSENDDRKAKWLIRQFKMAYSEMRSTTDDDEGKMEKAISDSSIRKNAGETRKINSKVLLGEAERVKRKYKKLMKLKQRIKIMKSLERRSKIATKKKKKLIEAI